MTRQKVAQSLQPLRTNVILLAVFGGLALLARRGRAPR